MNLIRMFEKRQIETYKAKYNQEISGRKITWIGGGCQVFQMDQYAKYSYTIISDQLQKLNPRLIMLSFTFFAEQMPTARILLQQGTDSCWCILKAYHEGYTTAVMSMCALIYIRHFYLKLHAIFLEVNHIFRHLIATCDWNRSFAFLSKVFYL